MATEWSPSTWGRKFTGSGDWRLSLSENHLILVVDGDTHTASIQGISPISIHRGIFWSDLTLLVGSHVVVDSIPNKHAEDIAASIEAVLEEQRLEKTRKDAEETRRDEAARRALRRERFHEALAKIQQWRTEMAAVIGHVNSSHRWLTHEHVQGFLNAKPNLDMTASELQGLLADSDVCASLGEKVEEAKVGVALWVTDLHKAAERRNEKHTTDELVACQALFEHVESRPLTQEQARAVICFDNRVQVVASAGSGKTSTMVAKAAYAIHRGLAPPDRIVLLAFNAAAATELEERAKRSFKRLGMQHVTVTAKTFHALGNEIIGHATGKKPNVPIWASEDHEGIQKLSELIDDLKDKSLVFRTQWDMFRLVFGRDVPSFGKAQPEDGWDATKKRGGLRTLRGELVKSVDECVIANWLFYNGVDYVYERRYEFETATPNHSQYHPDFFYPGIQLYHEHFALNKKGEPPKEFRGYLEGVAWKRDEHQRRGTQLIETTSHQLWTGTLFTHLTQQLTSRGITLDPNPDRPLPESGKAPLEHGELVELIRCFIRHAKSNGLSQKDLLSRLAKMPEGSFRYRHRLFLELVTPIREAWQSALKNDKGIDFEDMLVNAAEHVEQGRFRSPYELVLADEFQDASWARARLCLALVKEPGRHLFAVGDDWQSINRFAGADLSVMTGFRDWCGHGQLLRLEQTFRCPQALCDVSSHFISKNPTQLPKNVRSIEPPHGPVIQAYQVPVRDQLQSAIRGRLTALHQSLADGSIAPGRNGKVSVFVLGRYNADEQYVPQQWRRDFGDLIQLKFTTVHRSKGGEADYVILPAMLRRGFPSARQEDPVLSLAMPGSDAFPLAEERRLFYVALTRARRSVTLFTVLGQASSFLDELVADGFVNVTDTEGAPIQERRCALCKQGVIIQRSGRYGPFLACSNFPGCNHKPKH